jgi:deoxyadenosine/deoxycytidine kinase
MDDRELDLYFDYFHKLNRGVQQPDKVLVLEVGSIDVLLGRIRNRGRVEEQAISQEFIRGLSAYYTTFSTVCRNKYKLDTLTMDVSATDIRGAGREQFLDAVSGFLKA